MKSSKSPLLAFALICSSVSASPIIGGQNVTMVLENRATPTVVTAAILANMQLFAQYAAAAYCNADTNLVGSAVTCSNSACPSISSVTNYAYLGYDQSEATGFVSIDDTNKLIVVSYAGSDNLDNYIADLLVPLDTCDGNLVSGCKLHEGFQYAYEDVADTTLPAVKSAVAAYPTYSLVITGHSLGGAVATIAAAYLRVAGYPCDVYSYGSPRVGNEAFVNFMDAQAGSHYRVTHTTDPIPRYPAKLFGYRHTSPEFWLSTGTSTTVDYAVGDIEVCTGIANTDCNDGTSSVVTTPHSYYFEDISACR
ncbi:related to Lipase [Phialocephala subalpina]|uniref:Related to Lipase n=1 Tax=Phialocephala subalpina TaxID=576137 RepID=A0A1L7WUP4_9HELO|nr:related to Lipase [Phialocephala subalpina]